MPGWLDPSMMRVRWKEAQEQEARAALEAQVRELRASHERARELLAEIKYELAWRRLCRKYGYNPDQPRRPQGDPEGPGEWVKIAGAGGADSPNVRLAAMSWEERAKRFFGQKDLFPEVIGGGGGGPRGAVSLPGFRRNGPTAGILRVPGEKDIEIISGEGGPASRMPPGSRGFDAYTLEHVEGHAAARMRELKAEEGTLYVNHPKGPCPNCDSLLNRMLPPGAKLEVIWPGGAKTYEGIQP